jgi:hypothetical protein
LRPKSIFVKAETQVHNVCAYDSDGSSSALLIRGTWDAKPDVEQAIAGATGISLAAATTVPALLLHTLWGYPFGPQTHADTAPVTDVVAGHACYRVHIAGTLDQTVLVDQNTYLLDQVSSFAGNEVITNQKVNPPIGQSTFARNAR